LLVAIRATLSIILLADVNPELTYIPTTNGTSILGGLGLLDASLAPANNVNLQIDFTLNLNNILTDSTKVSSFSSSRPECSPDSVQCWSSLIPGGMENIVPDPVQSSADANGGDTYVVDSAPGYEVEFFPFQNDDNLNISQDCRTYSNLLTAFELCIKNRHPDLIIGTAGEMIGWLSVGWTACYASALSDNSCLQQPVSWNESLSGTMQAHVSTIKLTSGYNLFNSSIQFTTAVTEPETYYVGAADLFSIFDTIFANSNTTTSGPQGILIPWITSSISDSSQNNRRIPSEYNQIRALLLLSLVYVNSAYLIGNDTSTSRITTGHYVHSRFRIQINPHLLVAFVVLGCLVLVWCWVITIICSAGCIIAPNSTDFPEVDFAARVIKSDDFRQILDGLGNASSEKVKDHFMGKTLYLGVKKLAITDLCQTVELNTTAHQNGLKVGDRYM
jgi:hypothetical protein